MKFFIDTAKVEDIKAANDMGVICGVTTNPSLIAKEGRDFKEVIKEITSIVDGPISGEVKATTTDAEGMIKEGRAIAAIHPVDFIAVISLNETLLVSPNTNPATAINNKGINFIIVDAFWNNPPNFADKVLITNKNTIIANPINICFSNVPSIPNKMQM